MLEEPVIETAIDPGYVNMGVAQVEFSGFMYNTYHTVQIPVFRPLHAEVWNLREGICIRNSSPEGGLMETYRIPLLEGAPQTTSIDSYTASMNHFIHESKWIFERSKVSGRLPNITVENQCDHVKDKDKNGKDKKVKFDMFLISNEFSNAIHMADLINHKQANKEEDYETPLLFREMRKSSLKYGIANDGSRKYEGRKEDCVQIMRNLFKLTGLTGWLRYFDSVEMSGQKLDDVADAISLGLQKAIQDYELKLKNNKKFNEIVPTPMTTSSLRGVPLNQVNYHIMDNSDYPKLLSSKMANDAGEMIEEFAFTDLSYNSDDERAAGKKKRKRGQSLPKADGDKPKRKRASPKKKVVDDDSIPKVKKVPKPRKKKDEPTEKTTKKRKTAPVMLKSANLSNKKPKIDSLINLIIEDDIVSD